MEFLQNMVMWMYCNLFSGRRTESILKCMLTQSDRRTNLFDANSRTYGVFFTKFWSQVEITFSNVHTKLLKRGWKPHKIHNNPVTLYSFMIPEDNVVDSQTWDGFPHYQPFWNSIIATSENDVDVDWFVLNSIRPWHLEHHNRTKMMDEPMNPIMQSFTWHPQFKKERSWGTLVILAG